MNQEKKQPEDNVKASTEVETMNQHLDQLLGMKVREPGSAASMPAVIRIVETLEAAGGPDFPVFPPSYAGENKSDGPRYDLNGIEWEQYEKTTAKGEKKVVPYVKKARHCTMDAPQSHANRTEVAFCEDESLRKLVPQASARIPRKSGFEHLSDANLLELPHRVADFRVRASDQKTKAAEVIKAFAKGDALPLLRFMPTSVLFGFWDSRAEGYQHKHSRILLTRIDAFGVVPCERHSVYTGPYSKDECASVVLDNDNLAGDLAALDAGDDAESADLAKKAKDEANKWADKMAERGFSNALASGLGGVFAERIERLALISLTDIAGIYCFQENSDKPDKELTNAARRYLLALALLAEGYPRSKGSYRLRSGCELIAKDKKVELRGNGAETDAAKELLRLCADRDLLIKVAENARLKLGIPSKPSVTGIFISTSAGLKADLDHKEHAKLMEQANKAREKANKAREKAIKDEAAAKAAEEEAETSKSQQVKDRAIKKRQQAEESNLKADQLEIESKKAEAKVNFEPELEVSSGDPEDENEEN